MTIASFDRAITRAVAIDKTEDVMASILDPAVQLVLWRRDRPATLDWLDALQWNEIDDIDVLISGFDFGTEIEMLLREAGYRQTAHGRALSNEISSLARSFAQTVNSRKLRLRLEVIETDACRKFHMDNVTARLLMPLSGLGTQWIEAALGEEAPVNQLAVGEVGIFKGRLWAEEPLILHRSPPVAATCEKRLLLVLDPLEDAGEPFFTG